uniref:U23-Sparatoxin-Hju1l_1 n=1 Tax=Heteropoda jugulans TaxID=1358901 RepID=A0A4Q8KBW1_9ARAC
MSSTLYIALLITVLGTFVASEDPGFCPDYTDKVCSLYYKINDCCAQSDCPSYAICCVTGMRQRLPNEGRQTHWNTICGWNGM